MVTDSLYKLWTKNCLDLGVSDDGVKSMWEQLVQQYSESYRQYHTLEHIDAMVQALLEFEARLVAPHSVYAAIFFHDAVYDASSKTNEADSAAMAAAFLSQHAVEVTITETVESLILATASHLDEVAVPDADWFLDADLAILGSEPDRYAWYVSAIRHEYSVFSDDQFRAGRKRFLETVMEAETLFRTTELRNRFEARARSNLKSELDTLTAGTN